MVASGRSRNALSAMMTASTTSHGTKDFIAPLEQSDGARARLTISGKLGEGRLS
jgi:hypothetical protein